MLTSLLCLSAVLFMLNEYRKQTYRKKQSPYPPGPSTRPLIGNILSFPRSGGWRILTEHKRIYGDLVFFHGLGNSILVLNSLDSISDLLEKRADIYSDRPMFTVVGELMGLGQSLPLLPYGKEWREQRKLAHVALNPSATKRYYHLQEDAAALLNEALLLNPSNFFDHVRLAAGRIILSLTYGLSVKDSKDSYITHAESTMEIIGRSTVPGAFLCDLIPQLKYLPSWMPFQREAKKGRSMIEDLVTKPLDHVKQEMTNGTSRPSLALDLLSSNSPRSELVEHRIKWAMGSLYGAGGETTYATVLSFILAMALNPEKQRLAQAEIDRVIGGDRLPRVEDHQDLPYVCATIKEVMRWHPSLPLGIARMSTKDDLYKGYHVPKGTIIIPNTWAISVGSSEEDGLSGGTKFTPERYLESDTSASIPDPSRWAFGFGRRICPGKALAENSLFVMIAGILSAFNITPATHTGLCATFSDDLISYPDPFECQIEIRSQRKSVLVQQRANECR